MSFSSNSSDSTLENSENELGLEQPISIAENDHLVLENLFSNLTITKSLPIMAPPVFDTKLLDIVPKFDGNPLELSSYLETSNKLIITYWNSEIVDCVQNLTLIYGIYAKLIGKAREVYSICVSKDWKTVKSALIAHFGDQRDENGLLFDLDQLRQHANESSLQFYTRVMSNLSALHNYVDTHTDTTDINTFRVKKDFYNLHALKIFLAGLKEPLGSTVRAMKPKDLAEARQYIISESNIRHIQNPNRFEGNQNQFKPKHQIRTSNNPHQNLFLPNYQYLPNYNNTQPQQFMPQNQASFPRGPINIQPRPVPPQHFPTNRQVFGPPKNPTNVWKPNPQRAQYLPKPVPMSGISHGTIKPFRPQNS